MKKNINLTKVSLFLGLAINASTALAVTPLKDWRYTGNDTNDTIVGGLDLTGSLGYTDNDFIHMAVQYMNSPIPVTFQWSTLSIGVVSVDPVEGDVLGIIPDPVTGYDGNIAYIAADFSPGIWDGYSYNFNEFGQPCVDITDLTDQDVSKNLRCKSPRNSATEVSPNIAFAVIFLNTNAGADTLNSVTKRRFLLMHETGHTFGLDHNRDVCDPNTGGNPIGPSNSIMAPDSDPLVCNGVPTTLQLDDIDALKLKY